MAGNKRLVEIAENENSLDRLGAFFGITLRFANCGPWTCFGEAIITGSPQNYCHPTKLEERLFQDGLRCLGLGDVFTKPLHNVMLNHTVALVRLAFQAATERRLRGIKLIFLADAYSLA